MLNSYLDLRGIYLTNTQLEELQDYIYSNKILRYEIKYIGVKDIYIIDDIEDSSILSNLEDDKTYIDSPYYQILYIYNYLSDIQIKCQPNLNLHEFRKSYNLGSSASGMILSEGVYKDYDVFVKIFPLTANTRTFYHNGKIIRKYKPQLDNNALEIAFTNLFSSFLTNNQETPWTQNLVFVFDYQNCPFSFEKDISVITGEEIPKLEDYLVSNKNEGFTQESLMSRYNNGEIDDQVNILVVEKCSGDLERLLNEQIDNLVNGKITIHKFEETFDSVFMQIVLVLLMLNIIFNGSFSHGDLGPRNILYTLDQYVNTNEYFLYKVEGRSFYIKHSGYIPKMWDMSNVFCDDNVRNVLRTFNVDLSYLRHDDKIMTVTEYPIPNMPQLCGQIIRMSSFIHIKDSNFGKKMIDISNDTGDYYDKYISMFNNYIVKDQDILLKPIFEF